MDGAARGHQPQLDRRERVVESIEGSPKRRAAIRQRGEETMSEERRLQKMTESASLFLESGETIRAAAWGPSSELAYLIGVGSGRIAAVTQRHLYVFESPLWWRMSRPRGVVAKHAIGSVRIQVSGWVLRVGDERMVVHLHHRGRARRIAGLAADMSRPDSTPPADRRAV